MYLPSIEYATEEAQQAHEALEAAQHPRYAKQNKQNLFWRKNDVVAEGIVSGCFVFSLILALASVVFGSDHFGFALAILPVAVLGYAATVVTRWFKRRNYHVRLQQLADKVAALRASGDISELTGDTLKVFYDTLRSVGIDPNTEGLANYHRYTAQLHNLQKAIEVAAPKPDRTDAIQAEANEALYLALYAVVKAVQSAINERDDRLKAQQIAEAEVRAMQDVVEVFTARHATPVA